MGRPYSVDLRERVVAAFRSGVGRAEVAVRFEVSESSVQRWARRARESGSVAPKPMGESGPSRWRRIATGCRNASPASRIYRCGRFWPSCRNGASRSATFCGHDTACSVR